MCGLVVILLLVITILSRETADEVEEFEIRKVDETHGIGQAWVPALNIRDAKKKLTKIGERIFHKETPEALEIT